MTQPTGRILIIEDTEEIREMLARRLEREGHEIFMAFNGRLGMEALHSASYDLVLLDIMMPEMDGYQVLEHIRADSVLRMIPVVVMSALGEMESVVRCVKLGADDYLVKPFNPVLLRARVRACLEKKFLRDQEQAHMALLEAERAKSERLLLNILPAPISERLKQGETAIAEHFPAATVLFADIVGFTPLAASTSPTELVRFLGTLFSTFDALASHYGLEKIKTIGDEYMVVGGVPVALDDHLCAVADMALAIQEAAALLRLPTGEPLQLRVGLHSGPVTAGIIGSHKFSYDLWGHTVNVANRLEANAQPGTILLASECAAQLPARYQVAPRGEIVLKGVGPLACHTLHGPPQGVPLPPLAGPGGAALTEPPR